MQVIDWGVFRIHVGDCVEAMRGMAAESVDSIVTDPPYGIRFMGRAWDGADIELKVSARRAATSTDPSTGPSGGHRPAASEAGKYDPRLRANRAFQEWTEAWAREALRVLKPGGVLLSFASTRTYHRMTSGVEDAGFEIRDQIAWVFGSGFPKSHNGPWGGTAFKPAWEPVVVARKPLIGTVEENWRVHGTGALNIDACRVPTTDKLGGGAEKQTTGEQKGNDGWVRPWMSDESAREAHAARVRSNVERAEALGRWPANLIHDGSDEVFEAFPDAPGQQSDVKTGEGSKVRLVHGAMRRERGDEPSADSPNNGAVGFKMRPGARRLDSGSAARFFYCAKASRADRGPGNDHPTVKPTELMRYLCRLVTPVGGVVLDPFAGSGSTGKAAVLEGFKFVGCELSPEYADLAVRRISTALFGAHA